MSGFGFLRRGHPPQVAASSPSPLTGPLQTQSAIPSVAEHLCSQRLGHRGSELQASVKLFSKKENGRGKRFCTDAEVWGTDELRSWGKSFAQGIAKQVFSFETCQCAWPVVSKAKKPEIGLWDCRDPLGSTQ